MTSIPDKNGSFKPLSINFNTEKCFILTYIIGKVLKYFNFSNTFIR